MIRDPLGTLGSRVIWPLVLGLSPALVWACSSPSDDANKTAGSAGSATEYSFLFVEKAEFAKNLREVVQSQSLPPQFKWSVEQGSFEDKVGGLLASLKETGMNLAPTLHLSTHSAQPVFRSRLSLRF